MRQPGPWWLWAWLGLMALMLGMMDLYPRVIAPLFNRFTPLDAAEREHAGQPIDLRAHSF